MDDSAIKFDHVGKLYGEHNVHALSDISLVIPRGQFVVVIGPSGCGKSTLLNLAGGIDHPTQGIVSWQGQSLSLVKEKQLTSLRRLGVGFVFQFFNLIETLTVGENVALPLELAGIKCKQEIESRTDELLSRVGLLPRKTFYPSSLSGGEMQRTAIARALVHNPPLVLADEPTGNLDSECGADILKLLSSFNRITRQTILMATHSADAIIYADRVIKMRDGKIIGDNLNERSNEAVP